MRFDISKVRTEWSAELEGKKGWFSRYMNDKDDFCLRSYVENENRRYYGICHKAEKTSLFKGADGSEWKYFYPKEDIMEFDKKNLFIAGYNDEEVNIGDEGFFFDYLRVLPTYLREYAKNNKNYVPDSVTETYKSFLNRRRAGFQMFYRTKCASQKKYVPWTNEFVPGDLLGKKVRNKEDKNNEFIIVNVDKEHEFVVAGCNMLSFKDLLHEKEFLDGSPCGQEETNALI